MGEWREIPLGELVKFSSGKTPDMSDSSLWGGTIPWISAKLMTNHKVKTSTVTITERGLELGSKLAQKSDILILVRGSGLFHDIPINWVEEPVAFNQDIKSIRAHDPNLQEYLYYWLKSSKDYIYGILDTTGIGAGKFDTDLLRGLVVTMPADDSERQKLVEVASTLYAKIDLLHRQNKTLEAMAEALFRQWFVEEAEEWSQRPLSNIATYLNGVACQKYPAKDPANRLPVLKIKELSTGITDSSDWATSEIDPKYHVVAGDVVFSWSATLIVKLWDGPKAVLNQHLFKVTSDEYPKWFYFMWTKHHVDEFVAIAESHATTFGHIKRGDLDEAMVLVPSPERLKEMTAVMEPLFEKHITNSAQIKSLTALRDTLLPKLMSGEVRVEGTKPHQ